MTVGLRFCIAAAAALAALSPGLAVAQDATPPTSNTPATDRIGPRELQDFTLNGTVTRQAQTPPPVTTREPAPTRIPPPSASPATATTATRTAPAPRPREESSTVAPSRQPPQPRPSAAASVRRDKPSATPRISPSADETTAVAPGFTTSLPAPAVAPSEHSNVIPWLLSLLLIGVGAGYFFWRQRAAPSYAAAGVGSRFVPSEPQPPRPQPPVRGPSPPQPSPGTPAGVVSTRLRPWLDIEFAPSRCVVEEDKATIDFDIVIFNSGSSPAHDVLIEASLFNAGPAQDKEIGGFFANPVAKGDRIPTIPPLKRVAIKSAVSFTREQMRQFEVAGRRLFVPLIGFNTLYRWSGGDGQTSASYLLGRDTKGEKLAPFRLDLGPRIFRGLGAREHELRVRR